MNFVFVSLQRINTDRESTSTSLAKELSKEHRVLYVNPPIDRKTWLAKSQDPYIRAHIDAIKQRKAGLEKVSDKLWVLSSSVVIESVNWIPFTPVFSLFNWWNNRTFAGAIQSALRQIGMEDFILVNDKDMFRSFYLKELLRPALYVYLDRDYTLGFDYWRRHGVTLEPKLIAKSDAVVCNSIDFTRRAARYNPNSFYIGNGADLEVFNPEKDWHRPAELADLNSPVIGYVGALNARRIDISLIEQMALLRENWTFVLIGEEDEQFKKCNLHSIKNVKFFSKKHTSLIPAYVKFFDVCINPQLINEITIGNFPLKIVEYLAMGRPVVATETNTMREVFNEHTYLVKTPAEYVNAIERAMKEDDEPQQKERMRFARTHSWKAVADRLLNNILPLLKATSSTNR